MSCAEQGLAAWRLAPAALGCLPASRLPCISAPSVRPQACLSPARPHPLAAPHCPQICNHPDLLERIAAQGMEDYGNPARCAAQRGRAMGVVGKGAVRPRLRAPLQPHTDRRATSCTAADACSRLPPWTPPCRRASPLPCPQERQAAGGGARAGPLGVARPQGPAVLPDAADAGHCGEDGGGKGGTRAAAVAATVPTACAGVAAARQRARAALPHAPLLVKRNTACMCQRLAHARLRHTPLPQGWRYHRMDGGTPIALRSRLMADFNANARVSLFLLTTKVCARACLHWWRDPRASQRPRAPAAPPDASQATPRSSLLPRRRRCRPAPLPPGCRRWAAWAST